MEASLVALGNFLTAPTQTVSECCHGLVLNISVLCSSLHLTALP